jgi:RNA recognition motif-containing protein
MNIYAGTLSYNTTEGDLQDAFEFFGIVTTIMLKRDGSSGISKGYGFVEMSSEAEAQAAINGLDGRELNGQVMTIYAANPDSEGQLYSEYL